MSAWQIFRLALGAMAAAAALGGCSLPYAQGEPDISNSCGTDADCSGGAKCVLVGEAARCVASDSDLSGLVLEVRPQATIGNDLAISALVSTEGLNLTGESQSGQTLSFDPQLPDLVDVSKGQVFLPCAGETLVPARITFSPVAPLKGLLEGQSYTSDPSVETDMMFEGHIPTGTYDLYIEPDITGVTECANAPPIFLRGWAISKDIGALHVDEPLHLVGSLELSAAEDFTDWSLEVIEEFTGRIISEPTQIKQDALAFEVDFDIPFDWTVRTFRPVVRLRPPAGAAKPSIHWYLDGLALAGIDGQVVPVHLNVAGIHTQARPVGGQVLHGTDPVEASVSIRSLTISGDELTRYEVVVQTNEGGQFEADLPPGEYQVVARPKRRDLAFGVAKWTVVEDKDCYCGNAVEVPAATTVTGTVLTPEGLPADVEVMLTPASKEALRYLGTKLDTEIRPQPEGASAPDGEFQIAADPGRYDITFVPNGVGFPWVVVPQLLVGASETGPSGTPIVEDVGEWTLQSPVVVKGTVRDAAGTPLPGATVRAWLPVGTADSDLAASAVQVGEATADNQGRYVLLLPPSVRVETP